MTSYKKRVDLSLFTQIGTYFDVLDFNIDTYKNMPDDNSRYIGNQGHVYLKTSAVLNGACL
jgi:hypothetical protein